MTEIWYQGVEAKFVCFLMQLVMEMKEIWSQGMRAVELFVLWLFFVWKKKGTSIEIWTRFDSWDSNIELLVFLLKF